MDNMSKEEIIRFLKNNIEPIENYSYGVGYRASAYLVDGTFLPCVIFRNPEKTIDLAIKRFDDERSGRSIFKNSLTGYREIVTSFVTKGNCVNEYDIASVEKSRFAFPISILRKIKGETTMGWTGFVCTMKDGNNFGFGTRFLMNFFHMPENYNVSDIKDIINHSYVSKNGIVCSHKVPFIETSDDYAPEIIYRERPYFECYLSDL